MVCWLNPREDVLSHVNIYAQEAGLTGVCGACLAYEEGERAAGLTRSCYLIQRAAGLGREPY